MLLIFRKDRHRFSIVDSGIPASRYALAAVLPIGGASAIYLINSLASDNLDFGDFTGIPWAFLFCMPLGAFGEELGWRGICSSVSMPACPGSLHRSL
jgi:membrane protease YdiL (CAAX protease family)